jgi:hypothetical protein
MHECSPPVGRSLNAYLVSCSSDPYRYIRTGNYARILSQMAMQAGISTPQEKAMQEAAQKKEQMTALGLD